MTWCRWMMVPVVVFLFNGCSAESADTGGETNWLHCEQDDDCEGSASCIQGTCSSADAGATDLTPGNGDDSGTSSGGTSSSSSTSELSCGGDAMGAWRGVVPGLPEVVSEDPEHDGCWNLMFFENDDTLNATALLSMVSPDLERTLTLRIDSDGTQDQIPGLDSNVYQVFQEVTGPITQHFGPECMDFAGRQVACEELNEPLTQHGNGEGVWRSVVCTSAADDGCDCLLDYSMVTAEPGKWQLVNDQLVLTRFRYYPEGLGEEATSDPIDYCVSGDTLRFGSPMNDWWNDLAGVPLTRLDCQNVVPDINGGGVDCLACPSTCPQ